MECLGNGKCVVCRGVMGAGQVGPFTSCPGVQTLGKPPEALGGSVRGQNPKLSSVCYSAWPFKTNSKSFIRKIFSLWLKYT